MPVGAAIPGAPTGVSAVPGDTQAYVSWTAPVSSNGAIVISYTVTALVNGIPSGISSTIAAPATSSVNTIVSGLTDGTEYSFSVHATSSAGNGREGGSVNCYYTIGRQRPGDENPGLRTAIAKSCAGDCLV